MVTVSFLDAVDSARDDKNRLGPTSTLGQMHLLNHVQGSHRIYRRNQCLVERGGICDGIYLLRSGSAKGFQITSQAHCVLTDFFYPGDVIGLDALDKCRFVHTVQFLESSSVSYISIRTIDKLLAESTEFRASIVHLMSRAINHAGQLHTATSHFSSQRRLASFLLYISNRFAILGFSAIEFNLTMTRADIANYLGMAVETLSRLLTRLQKQKIIQIENRFCVITDRDQLDQIACGLACTQ